MVFSAAEQATSAARVKPFFYAKLAVNHTKKTFCLALLPPIICLVIILVTGALSLDTPDNMDYAIRNDIRTRLEDSRIAAATAFRYVPPGAPDDGSVPERTQTDPELTLSILFRGRVGRDGEIGVFNETDDQAENVFSREGVRLMKQAEDRLLAQPGYGNFCMADPNGRDCEGNPRNCVLPDSMLNSKWLYGKFDGDELCGREEGAELVPEDDWRNFLNELYRENEAGEIVLNGEYSRYLGIDFSIDTNETWITKSSFEMAEPFKGFKNPEDRESDQEEQYKDWATEVDDKIEELTTPTTDVFLIGFTLIDASFSSIAFRDLSFSIGAIALVFLVIWLHTTSVVLAGTAMLQIFLAFPFAYFFYYYVVQQRYFASLQLLVVFLVLGIGADDVFVFTDAWKQSAVVLGSDVDLVTRMSWTYRRAVLAMCVTSFTTAIAFFLTATSPIMPIATLGFWAGLLILFQFLLVITIYPCSIIFWYRFWRPRTIRNCFKPPVEDEEKRAPLWHRCLPAKWRPDPVPDGVDEYRILEKFFRGPWLNFIRKGRFFVLGLGVILVGVSIYLATQLEPPKEEEQFLPKKHPLSRAVTSLQDAFPRSDVDLQLQVKITWGLRDIDRTGTSRFTPDIPGRAVLDDTFDFTKKEAQQQVLNACDFFGNNTDLIFQGDTLEPIECWIRDWVDWRNSSEGKNEFETYNSGNVVVDELIRFANYNDSGRQPYKSYLLDQQFAFSKEQDRVVFTEVGFVSPTETSVPYQVMWPVYTAWQDELKKFNPLGPDGANKAICTGDYPWLWQITQRKLVSSMFANIGIMLAVAFVTLFLTSLNWNLALLSTMTIGSIVAMLLAFIELMGWQLGITETVAVVISVGYSFDGAAHLATAYAESLSSERYERTQDALTDLGISILFGAISTLLAGVMLFPAIIVFFVKFGALLVATVVLSMVWTLFFFPALLVTFGPSGEFGSLKPLLRKAFGKSSDVENKGRRDAEKAWPEGESVIADELPFEYSRHVADYRQ